MISEGSKSTTDEIPADTYQAFVVLRGVYLGGCVVCGGEVLGEGLHLRLDLRGDGVLGVHDGVDGGRLVGGLDVLQPLLGEVRHLRDLHSVGVSLDSDEEGHHDVLHLHGLVLALLQQLVQTHAAVQLLLRGGVEVGAELGECGHLTVLGELQLHSAGHLLHGLHLRGGPHARHGETHGDGGALALVEQLGLQEDLAVSDGDHVGGDVGGHITSLGLDHGQGGERAGAQGVTHLGGALEQAGVQVEHITGVGLTPRGAAQQQRHLAVGDCLLGQIVVEDHGVLAVVAEVLTHGAASVGGQELQGGGVGGSGGHDDGVVDGLGLLERAHQLCDGGALLAHAHVDAHELVLLALRLLVDDGVDRDGGLACLAIANDQLTLAAADGDQGVHGLKAGGHGLVHGLSGNDAGSLHLSTGA
mmetsp:Transcript_3483/g.7918  ORF Transcript_3483/g.7918 Transcript_3483/m.7918 type:complete len:415 (-) Transcript_3483:37-1281(-)